MNNIIAKFSLRIPIKILFFGFIATGLHLLVYVTIYCIDMEFLLVLFNSDYVCLSVIPVVIYDNADKEKGFVIKNNRKKSGIYR